MTISVQFSCPPAFSFVAVYVQFLVAADSQDGLLYYVRFKHAGELTTPTWPDSAGYSTIKSAMKAAEERTPGAITWNPSSSLNQN